MNYYERHLGDYARDTGHLSLLEHGVYTLLLDRYYATEQGIPADKAYRFARASSPDEKAAVDSVLAEFFQLVGGVWVKGRIEEEIARYKDSSEDNEERRKHETERKRRYRQRRKELFAVLREVGIVPAFDTSIEVLEDMVSRHVSRGTGTGTGQSCDEKGTANQTPDTSHKSEIDTHATLAGECGKAMRDAGCFTLNQSDPDFLAALDEGVKPKEFADAVEAAKGRGISGAGLFTYAIRIARTNHAKTPNEITGTNHGNAISGAGRKLSAVEQVQQAILERRGREPFEEEPGAVAAIGCG